MFLALFVFDLYLVYPMLPVSLDGLFLVTPWVFYNIYVLVQGYISVKLNFNVGQEIIMFKINMWIYNLAHTTRFWNNLHQIRA